MGLVQRALKVSAEGGVAVSVMSHYSSATDINEVDIDMA